jgi:fatty acid-binding protein DegV
MPKIAVIADTDASLSPEFAKEQVITLVPILINFGSESFASGVDIDDKALFERIDKEGALPKTAAPSPGAFIQAFRKEFDAGAEGIVCVCVSSEISATYAAALTAKEDFPGKQIPRGLNGAGIHGHGSQTNGRFRRFPGCDRVQIKGHGGAPGALRLTLHP